MHAGWLAELIPADGYLPDFLTPLPGDLSPSLGDELDAIRGAPIEHVRADLEVLGRRGSRTQGLQADPECRLPKLAQEIEAYWDLAIAPYWAKIRALLEADVFYRARQVAERGAGHLFNDLHSTVSWDDSTLRLVRRCSSITRAATGPGLLLVPSAFAASVLTWSRHPGSPQVAYPARGTGTLWEHRPVARSQAIAAVIGRSRTMLLTELEAPASTTDLARRTGISAAGVCSI